MGFESLSVVFTCLDTLFSIIILFLFSLQGPFPPVYSASECLVCVCVCVCVCCVCHCVCVVPPITPHWKALRS